MSTPEPLVPSPELLRRILDADCAYTASRLGVLGRLPGNPVGVEARRIGPAWAYRARYLLIESFNRVVGLADDQADQIAMLVAWFADNGSTGRFEIAPGAPMANLAAALTTAGYAHGGFHATLFGDPDVESAPLGDGIEVEVVSTPEVLDTFLDVYGAGWGIPKAGLPGFKANVGGWLREPGWSLYLARCDGQPAGEAILYQSGGVGYLADSSVDPAFSRSNT